MRPLWKDILAAAWLGILIPGIVLNAAVLFARKAPQEAAAEPRPEPSETVTLTLETGNITLSMEDYLTGVVLAEMPASFHPEALKAQTVAAGTYGKHQEATRPAQPAAALQALNVQGSWGAGHRQLLEEATPGIPETSS